MHNSTITINNVKSRNMFVDVENTMLKKISMRKDNNTISKNPSYKVLKIDSSITIRKSKCSGEVKEIAKYELSNGYFSLIIRKISLAGTANSLVAFKLSSK